MPMERHSCSWPMAVRRLSSSTRPSVKAWWSARLMILTSGLALFSRSRSSLIRCLSSAMIRLHCSSLCSKMTRLYSTRCVRRSL